MGREVEFPGGAGRRVTQSHLRRYYLLTNQIAELEQRRAELLDEILDLLLDGAPVEPGSHEADLERESGAGRVTFRLRVDGRPAAGGG